MENEEPQNETQFELNPVKVPQYLIDIYNFIENQKIPSSIDLSETNTLDAIVYGIQCKKQVKQNKYVNCVIFQASPETQVLSVAMPKSGELEHIDITQITNVSLLPTASPSLAININSLMINFEFVNLGDLMMLLKSLLVLYEKYILNDENLVRNKALKIWQKYDTDFNNKLDFKEFSQFFNDLNLSSANSMPISKEELFRILDSNKNGVIDYEEFLNFYLTFTNGAEFQEIFLKYSSDLLYLNVKDLQNFLLQEQKERCTLEKCGLIILSHKQNLTNEQKQYLINKINKKEKLTPEEISIFLMTLSEFKLYLISQNYNNALLIQKEDSHYMSHPLYDYFINSTHNTYLSGHQITGDSTPDMYGIVLINGCRLVEIDCYNIDSTGDVVVTHGYTIVNKIHLTDIFQEIKAKAFNFSEYPVIFSVENHMNAQSQQVFVQKCKEILQNFYVIDPNHLPRTYPTPEELKEKFIVKLGGRRYYLPKEEKNDVAMDVDDTNMNKDLDMMTSKIDVGNNQPLKRKMGLTSSNINEDEITQPKQEEKPKEPITDTIEELDSLRGMFAIKFDINTIETGNYQPWELATMKCTKVLNYSSHTESRRSLIKFNSKSFTKAYPVNFDSTNYDLVKAWITGTQIAAINFQCLEDDFTLLNKVFFEAHNNTGYVLKPKKFWNDSKTFELYDFPYGSVSIDIITAIGIDDIINRLGVMIEDKFTMTIDAYIIGSLSDEKMNKKYSLKVSGNFIIPTIEKITAEFDVYEKDLSHFYFKIVLNSKTIARGVLPLASMKEGIRSITLYDDKCAEYKNSALIAKIKKNLKPYKKKY